MILTLCRFEIGTENFDVVRHTVCDFPINSIKFSKQSNTYMLYLQTGIRRSAVPEDLRIITWQRSGYGILCMCQLVLYI